MYGREHSSGKVSRGWVKIRFPVINTWVAATLLLCILLSWNLSEHTSKSLRVEWK